MVTISTWSGGGMKMEPLLCLRESMHVPLHIQRLEESKPRYWHHRLAFVKPLRRHKQVYCIYAIVWKLNTFIDSENS